VYSFCEYIIASESEPYDILCVTLITGQGPQYGRACAAARVLRKPAKNKNNDPLLPLSSSSTNKNPLSRLRGGSSIFLSLASSPRLGFLLRVCAFAGVVFSSVKGDPAS
jgi:hypothetical protein